MTAALLRTARIMAVDDEPTNLKLLQKVLEGGGHATPELVQDPREVLARYAAQRPDLILLDLNMPHLDGYGVLEALTGLGDPRLPPVVVLTAQSGREHVLRALRLGARDFLSKPFDRLELLMRVRNLLEAQLAHRLLHDQRDTLEALVRARSAAWTWPTATPASACGAWTCWTTASRCRAWATRRSARAPWP